MQVERTSSDALVENKLPDGSRVLLDTQSQRVFALNATAGAAWDACRTPSALPAIAAAMQRSLDTSIAEEAAEHAVLQLQEQNLVKVHGAPPASASRREFITRLGAAAVPLVVAMTMTEQRAYARLAQSFVGPEGQCTHLPCDTTPGDPFQGGAPWQGSNPTEGGNPWQRGNNGGFNPPDPRFPFSRDPNGPQH